ncbi:30S ribosome-binding factor RbfA [Thioalkalivibrio sp. XN279]|uniref:30S ribosome-binding factor RbfA n=1 Tax=Thioalkalivibrio sp. XN279 TaxID=2714953 RepID=UPI00140CC41A|nr:30S ribosome-binding factor RbfA [Thioalkalivibrio sp. XN279]NHA14550.1 30S ribosome-binding factor RbfA [Thioalkalivibrio sp. XN279]
MPKDYARSRRVGEQMQRLLGEVLLRDVKDPRVEGVSITAVEVSRDLSHATVWYSLLDPAADPAPAGEALARAAGLIRGKLGRAMYIRHVPALHFRHDESVERGARLSELIDRAVAADKDRPDNDD